MTPKERAEWLRHLRATRNPAALVATNLLADLAEAEKRLEEAEKPRADFLWPHEDGSLEALGYEFANAKTEEYRREVWRALVAALAGEEKP